MWPGKFIRYKDGGWYVVLREDYQEVWAGPYYFWFTAWCMSCIPGFPAFRAR